MFLNQAVQESWAQTGETVSTETETPNGHQECFCRSSQSIWQISQLSSKCFWAAIDFNSRRTTSKLTDGAWHLMKVWEYWNKCSPRHIWIYCSCPTSDKPGFAHFCEKYCSLNDGKMTHTLQVHFTLLLKHCVYMKIIHDYQARKHQFTYYFILFFLTSITLINCLLQYRSHKSHPEIP